MGCAQSKIDNEESVSRCKERRNLMKEAVSLRNAFASAHSGFSVSLKDTGAALSDYAQGEVPPPRPEAVVPQEPPPSDHPPPPPPPPVESSLPPPPPPLPSFSPITPLQRSVTMPAVVSQVEKKKGKMKGIAIDESDIYEEEEEEEEKGRFRRRKKDGLETPTRTPNQMTPPEIKGMAWDYFFMDNVPQQPLNDEVEDEEGGYMEERSGDHSGNINFNGIGGTVEFKTPEKQVGPERIEEFKAPEETPISVGMEKHFLHSKTAPPAINKVGFGVGEMVGSRNSVDLLKVLSDIDDHFLKASQSAQEVSKMLEATRLHYHSNFADNRGHIDHAARVMQVITWNKSFKGSHSSNEGTKETVDAEDYETHATVLDKLLAWEKKLYEEVKAGELIKLEYQRKVSVLNKLKKRKASSEQLEKAKAAVSHLHTRYIVDMQSLDSTVSEVNDIRDKQLYPKLISLIRGMTNMWESICSHHDSQLKIVVDLKFLDASRIHIETSKQHHERTKQLSNVVDEWHSQFEKLVTNQRQYIGSLNSWLKLNLVPIESSLKEKISSPPRTQTPPIQPLLHAWKDLLEKLPDEIVKNAISSFAAVVKTIIIHQEEEMKLKDKYEETRKEYFRKKHAYDEWHQKYMLRRTPQEEDTDKAIETGAKDPVSERKFVVESVEKKLEDEMEDHQKHCLQVREKSVGSLKIRLPELFRALYDYAHACYDGYERLRLITESQRVK
ncbi:protein ALTERED PHOSPHATE STARVATION RESPONSE 1-like [Henckelia pumila]|uniref:protein ALTERED PHOSPHATE STARVATION RESPONSE 1-like n=1 Tax=Henckelia pumila TaxID=405737 RepID=UPI003C6E5E4A